MTGIHKVDHHLLLFDFLFLTCKFFILCFSLKTKHTKRFLSFLQMLHRFIHHHRSVFATFEIHSWQLRHILRILKSHAWCIKKTLIEIDWSLDKTKQILLSETNWLIRAMSHTSVMFKANFTDICKASWKYVYA